LEDASITRVCECWEIPKIKEIKQQFDVGVLKEPSDICDIILTILYGNSKNQH
jgi:hypothetical protein